jgi:ribosomal protein L28
MALKCELCGKKSVAGGSHVHHRGVAGGQWKRRAPHTKRSIGVNLHWVSFMINGTMSRVHACAKCIKRVRFDNLQKKAVVSA